MIKVMLRYKYPQIEVNAIPDEISLVFAITGCTLQCPKCHSKDTWNINEGTLLTIKTFNTLIKVNKYITCVLFYGGEWDSNCLVLLLQRAKQLKLQTALYTGQELFNIKLKSPILLQYLDYIKVGNYNHTVGGLNFKTTNQILYKINNNKELINITYKLQKEV